MRILNPAPTKKKKMEFISLGPEDEQQEEGDLQMTTAAASEHQPQDDGPSTMDSSTTKASPQDIIDLEEGQFPSEEPHAKEPLASEHQPQATPDAKDPPVEIIDLEEGQVATDQESMLGGLKLQAAEAMVANGVEPLSSSEHQPVEDISSAAHDTKASDEIVDLEEGQVACAAQGDLILEAAEAPDVNGVEALASSELKPQEDGTKVSDGLIIDLEEGQLEDMDLSDDDNVVLVKRQPSDDAPVQSQTSAPAAQLGVSAPVHATSSTFIDETPPRGVKRARVESAEPSVRVVYNNLTRESKRRLMELMQQWSEWQARKQHSLTESVEEILECGEETYYPALHVGSDRYSVSFCVDYQARDYVAVDDAAVPLYNREFTLGSTPLGDSSNAESKQDKEDSRCFNCGSYSHALKDCPKPRDHVAISNARKQHNSKRNLSNANRGQNRYYQKTPGKFDDLKAGVLGAETRECLGLREGDPPPWLHRMRELGYPPGYLDEVEDEDKPSGITIFVDGETKTENEEGELPEKGSPPRKKMTVEFPGINAPVPENGDPWLWGSTPPPQSSSGRHHHHPSSDSRDRVGPPGAEHYSSSRHHPYDHGVLGATPGLVRSHSDRSGRRSSSSSYYDNPPPPPPPPGEEATWTPHGYSSRQHSSSSERHSRDRERERERDRHYYSSSSRR